jgi:phage antirepressor YoqD-like protein
MKELTKEKVMTTRELAEQLGTDKKVIIENAKKYLPNKIFEQGKPTYWNEAEITVLIDGMKGNNSNQYREKGSVTGAVTVVSTDLTPALKIKKAMELMQEGYEEELAILRAKNEEQEQKLLEQKPKVEFFDDVTGSNDTIDMKEAAKILSIKGIGRNKLFEILREKKILDRNNQPYQKYVDLGYFRIIESKWQCGSDIKITLKTVVFQKGLDFIRKIAKQGV